MQLQQEPETTLPHIGTLSPIVETANVPAPLKVEKKQMEQSAVVERLVAALEQSKRKRKKWSRISLNCYMGSLNHLLSAYGNWVA